jgi:hypothetical protein
MFSVKNRPPFIYQSQAVGFGYREIPVVCTTKSQKKMTTVLMTITYILTKQTNDACKYGCTVAQVGRCWPLTKST